MHGALADLGEEVIALVIDEDEGGEVLHFDFPNGLHPKLGEVDNLLAFNVLLGE